MPWRVGGELNGRPAGVALGHPGLVSDPKTTAKHMNALLPGSMVHATGEGPAENELGLGQPDYSFSSPEIPVCKK